MPRGKRTRSPWTSAPALAQEPQRVGVAAELEADLLEDRVGVALDDREALLAEDLERGHRPGQERLALDHGMEARRAAGVATAGAVAGSGVGHRSSLAAAAAVAVRVGAVVALPCLCRRLSPSAGRGSSTTVDRCGNGAVRCGNAIASTKCSWNRGSTAVSIFSTVRTTSSISRRAALLTSAIRAPVPGGVAGGLHVATGRSPGSARGPSRGTCRSGCRTRRRAGSRRPSRCRRGPSAAGRRRRARPSRAGSPGRRSG